MDIGKEIMLQMYRTMVTIRQFEEKVAELFAQGKLPGFIHLYVGQEAVAVGTCANLRSDDWITSNHRGHGHLIAKGGDVMFMFSELYGKSTGYCKGKGGSQHIADLDKGILGANGIVAGSLPIANGAAFAARQQGTGQVVVCFFGDGASNEGAFHESLNLAALWRLPVVFVCENNLYGEFTRQDRHQAISDVADRAAAYAMPGVVVNGNDVLAVHEVTGEAIERARSGGGPTLVECKTYRWYGHFQGDDGSLYRTKEEVDAWKARDPILSFRNRLIERGVLSEEGVGESDDEVRREIEAAVSFAEESPFPQPEELLSDVYTTGAVEMEGER